MTSFMAIPSSEPAGRAPSGAAGAAALRLERVRGGAGAGSGVRLLEAGDDLRSRLQTLAADLGHHAVRDAGAHGDRLQPPGTVDGPELRALATRPAGPSGDGRGSGC